MEQVYRKAHAHWQSLVRYLVSAAYPNSGQIIVAAATEFGVPLLDLDAVDRAKLSLNLVDEKLVRKHQALPIFRLGKRLFLAVSDPTDYQALDEIGFATNLATHAVLVEEAKRAVAIEQVTKDGDRTRSNIRDTDLDYLEGTAEDEVRQSDAGPNVDDALIVRYVNQVLLDAIDSGASDIHFEPYARHCRIRFHQDGLLRAVTNPPVNNAAHLVARLKLMSRMNMPNVGCPRMDVSSSRSAPTERLISASTPCRRCMGRRSS